MLLLSMLCACTLTCASSQNFQEFQAYEAKEFQPVLNPALNPDLMLDAWAFIRVEAALIRKSASGNPENLNTWVAAHKERREKFHAQFAPFCAPTHDANLIAPFDAALSDGAHVESLNEAFGALNVSFIEHEASPSWLPAFFLVGLCAWLPCRRCTRRKF
jgi:hypothetical protein